LTRKTIKTAAKTLGLEKKPKESSHNVLKILILVALLKFYDSILIFRIGTAAIVTKLHSAYFCLANNVPFNFISYDIKCDYLLEMLYDSIAPYNLNLYDLENFRIEKKMEKLIKTLTAHLESMRSRKQV